MIASLQLLTKLPTCVSANTKMASSKSKLSTKLAIAATYPGHTDGPFFFKFMLDRLLITTTRLRVASFETYGY